MKKILIILIIGLCSINCNSVFSQNNSGVTSVQIGSVIKSKTKNNNATSAFIVGDVYDKDGNVWIKASSPVTLSVKSKKAKGMGKPGYIDIQCVSTTDVNGRHVTLRGSTYVEGDDKKGAALGCGLGLGLTVLPVVGFFFFCIQGENVTLPPSTVIPNVIVSQ